MSNKINSLLKKSKLLYRGRDFQQTQVGVSTAFAELDRILPQCGWPRFGLIEVVLERHGIGELQLFLPLLRTLSCHKRRIIWVRPPFIPYAPALRNAGIEPGYNLVINANCSKAQALWSMEKLLAQPSCGLLFCWFDRLSYKVLRRLQAAINKGRSYVVIFSSKPFSHSNPELRLRLSSLGLALRQFEAPVQQLQVQVLKAKNCFQSAQVDMLLPIAAGFCFDELSSLQ